MPATVNFDPQETFTLARWGQWPTRLAVIESSEVGSKSVLWEWAPGTAALLLTAAAALSSSRRSEGLRP